MSRLTWDHFRSEWEYPDAPVTGPAFDWGSLAVPETPVRHPGIVFHRNGVPNFPSSTYDSIRSSDRWHRRIEPGRSPHSIGYNGVLNGRDGDLWQARGDDYRCAANVGRNWVVNQNPFTIALQIIVAGDEPASPAAVARARIFVAECRAAAKTHLPIRPHRFYEAPHGSNTSCPGAGIIAQIEAGEFEPTTTPTPPPQEDEMRIYLAYAENPRPDGTRPLHRGNGLDSNEFDRATQLGMEGRPILSPRNGPYYHPLTEERLTHWDQVPTITANQIILDLGKPR